MSRDQKPPFEIDLELWKSKTSGESAAGGVRGVNFSDPPQCHTYQYREINGLLVLSFAVFGLHVGGFSVNVQYYIRSEAKPCLQYWNLIY